MFRPELLGYLASMAVLSAAGRDILVYLFTRDTRFEDELCLHLVQLSSMGRYFAHLIDVVSFHISTLQIWAIKKTRMNIRIKVKEPVELSRLFYHSKHHVGVR